MGEPWPILMICKTRKAADEFEVRGDDLLMIVAVYDELVDAKRHGLFGEGSVWRYRGERVDMGHLVRQLLYDLIRLDLFEFTDSRLELGNGLPSPDVGDGCSPASRG